MAPGEAFDIEPGRDLVVKPTVGAGSHGVARTHGDTDLAARLVGDLHAAGRTAMIQPYLERIEQNGETCLLYLGGEFSHAVNKRAILTGTIEWTTELFAEETVVAHHADPAERALADRIVGGLADLAYARVDVLPTPDGPVLLELELVEPSLYLDLDPDAPRRAAAAFARLSQ